MVKVASERRGKGTGNETSERVKYSHEIERAKFKISTMTSLDAFLLFLIFSTSATQRPIVLVLRENRLRFGTDLSRGTPSQLPVCTP